MRLRSLNHGLRLALVISEDQCTSDEADNEYENVDNHRDEIRICSSCSDGATSTSTLESS